ncbi:MAG TPA: hypothetical protein VFH48_03430 [Chloroflexota bacterium]|nr:hypothetical protein [Chloroflexota bacterium]
MRHTTVKLLVLIVPSAIVAGMVMILGATMPASPLSGIPFGRPAEAPFVDAGTCLEAAAIPFAAPGASGRAMLCDDGQGIRITFLASGLPPGERYTAWLGYTVHPTACRDAACRQLDAQSDDPGGSMQQIGQASVPPSGILEVEREMPDLRLVRGAQVVVQLLGERGRAGPYVQASFAVP